MFGFQNDKMNILLRKNIFRIFLVFFILELGPQSYSSAQHITPLPRMSSASLWVYSEEVPGNEKYSPRAALEKTALFIISGMVFGWKFEYTPSDKARNVPEYFSIEPITEISPENPNFSLSHIQNKTPRLYGRAEFIYDEAALQSFTYWNSIIFKTSEGRGYGERRDETAGILQAYTNALKQAVREYARTIEKNKPKEIRGDMKLKEEPRLFADQGQVIAEVRVLLNIKEIVPYTVF